MSSAWGYTELSSAGAAWPQAGVANRCDYESFDPLDRSLQQAKKFGGWDSPYGRVGGAAKAVVDQECPSWPARLPPQGFDAFDQAGDDFIVAGGTFGAPPESIGGRSSSSSSNVVNNTRFDVEGTFLDESAVTSSCHFPLPDDCFGQAPTYKEVTDDGWDGIGTLHDMDDLLLGHNPAFMPANSVDVLTHSFPKISPETSKPLMYDQQQVPVVIQQQPSASKRLKTPLPSWSSKPQESCRTFQPEFSPPPLSDERQQTTTSIEQLLLLQRAMNYNNKVIRREPQGRSNPVLDAATQSPAWLANHYTISSSPEEASLEAAVLYQLGSTMTKLDVGTRLCIRNALYRLARSASYRNREESVTVSAKRAGDIAGLETCTNPIDRTVASLLFYKKEIEDRSSGSASPQSTVASSNSWIPQLQPSMGGERGGELGGGEEALARYGDFYSRVV